MCDGFWAKNDMIGLNFDSTTLVAELRIEAGSRKWKQGDQQEATAKMLVRNDGIWTKVVVAMMVKGS